MIQSLPEGATVVHVGLYKTATSSLQANLFARGRRPYVGLHDGSSWAHARKAWLPAFLGDGRIPPGREAGGFVFSDESLLLRAGGIATVPALGRRIARAFPSPYVLVTVREPSSLLVSAYFQSLRLRRIALGFAEGRPKHQRSTRFTGFREWWEALEADRDASLSGLLDYARLEASLVDALGPGRVVVLPMEWIGGAPADFDAGLHRLGFGGDEIAGFRAAPSRNVRATKRLDRMRPWAYRLGRFAQARGLDGIAGALGRGPLRPLLERLIYAGRQLPSIPGGPDPATLAEIDARYGAAWRAVDARRGAPVEGNADV